MRRFIIPLGVLAVATYKFYSLDYAVILTLICTAIAAVTVGFEKLTKAARHF